MSLSNTAQPSVRSVICAGLTLVCVVSVFLSGCNGNATGKFTPAQASLKDVGGSSDLKELQRDLVFRKADANWTAPKGTHTDGASIPTIFLPVTGNRFDESFLKAAIVHDAYCQGFNETRCPDQYQSRSWQDTHNMFYDACITCGTSRVLAKLMWVAVWVAGPRWDDPDSEPAEVREEAFQHALTGYKEWIEKEDPSIDTLKAEVPQQAKRLFRMYENEQEIARAIERGDVAEARRVARIQRRLLDTAPESTPEKLTTETFRGLLLLSRSKWLRQEPETRDAGDRALDEAERRFRRIETLQKNDPAALRGLAEVAAERGNREEAERRIDRAIEVAPKFRGAKRARDVIRRR